MPHTTPLAVYTPNTSAVGNKMHQRRRYFLAVAPETFFFPSGASDFWDIEPARAKNPRQCHVGFSKCLGIIAAN